MASKTKEMLVAKFPEPDAGAKAMANLALRPAANAAAVVAEYSKPFGEQDLGALMGELEASIGKVADGDMKRCEAMLMGQAEALQTIFMNLSRRALVQQYQRNLESFFRMAMKAQNQCRMTLETLATIKNPPVVIAKQANIANGPQQINNDGSDFGTRTRACAREEKAIQPNEVLSEEVEHGPTLDTRGTAAAGRVDQKLATVGAIDRAKDTRR